MTRYMLDTGIISDLIKYPQGFSARRIAELGDACICTSIIVAGELRYGHAKKNSDRLRMAVEDVLSEIEVLPFEAPADVEYGDIRARLEAAGKTIGGNDLLIAAHALAVGATIATRNTSEFERVPGLQVENWPA